MKNKISVILLIFFFASCTQEEFILTENSDFTPVSNKGYLINHSYYTLSYSSLDRQSEFAYYLLKPESINGTQPRTDDFRIDPFVKSNPVKSTDYQGSGFDRGHLCPAGDMSLNFSSMSETFFMSNMSPMTPSFNRGIWSKLESWVRNSALSMGELYVVTGPVLNKSCGVVNNSINIPCSFYKIVYKSGKTPQVIGFILSNSGSTTNLKNFTVSIDEIETLTGIDFFPQLQDDIENRLESKLDFNGWGL